jgi:hypothetical protein
MADKTLQQGQSLEYTDKTLYSEISPSVYAVAQLAVLSVGGTPVSASNPLPVTGGGCSPVTETTGTFSYDESSAAEQDALELTITERTSIGGIWFDMNNVTKEATIRAYHKIDGTNYRIFLASLWADGDDPGVLIPDITAYRDIKVTFECDGSGAGVVSVPYVVV